MECGTGEYEDVVISEKRFGLGHERGGRFQAQHFVTQEVAQSVPLCGPKGPKAQIQRQELLMLRDGLTPLGIVLDQRGIEGDLMGDKAEEIVEQFQGCCAGKRPVSRRNPS
jgi:hypothetical protein